MITLDRAKAKEFFFDRDKVKAAMDAATARALAQSGYYLMKAAQWSIKDRKTPSLPGNPPHSHTGALRRNILFSADTLRDTVVIGPIKLNQVSFDSKDHRPIAGTVPSVLEFSGQITVKEVRYRGGKWQRADLRSRRRLAGAEMRYRNATVAARPFMGPALQKNLSRIPAQWQNALRGGD